MFRSCSKCRILKSTYEFYKKNGVISGLAKTCRKCHNIEIVERRKGKEEYYKEYYKEYRQRPEAKERHNEDNRERRLNLLDDYIVSLIKKPTRLLAEEIKARPELIEQKRAIIQLKRTIKNLKQNESRKS